MKNLLIKFLGPLLAVAGVLGLSGASILWNFQGRSLGLPATVLSLLILTVGVVLLRPLQPASSLDGSEINDFNQEKNISTVISNDTPENPENQSSSQISSEKQNIDENSVNSKSTKASPVTTAEAIAAELAEAQANKPKIELVNFAPEAFRPGNSLRSTKRLPGRNLSNFQEMASDLFKTN